MIKIPQITIKYPRKRKIPEIFLLSNNVYKILGKSGHGKTTYINEIVKFFIESNKTDIIYLKQSHKLPPFSKLKDVFFEYDLKKSLDLLKNLNVNKSIDSNCSELSGGEIQRVLIAEAILFNPKLIIMDEPVSAVDKKGIEVISKLLIDYVNRGGIIVYVSHVELTKNFNEIKI